MTTEEVAEKICNGIAEDWNLLGVKEFLNKWKSTICKQQREVCANNYERTRCENLVGVIKDAWDSQRGKNFASSLKDSILNAPEPD